MIQVIYWSGTGNTEKMANLIVEGIQVETREVNVKEVASASVDDAVHSELIVLGCPSMGAEVLEEDEMQPFVDALEDKVKGKKVALFGSYGWGDGEWMRDWDERMKSYGAIMVEESLIINEKPEGEDEEKCRAFGRSLARHK